MCFNCQWWIGLWLSWWLANSFCFNHSLVLFNYQTVIRMLLWCLCNLICKVLTANSSSLTIWQFYRWKVPVLLHVVAYFIHMSKSILLEYSIMTCIWKLSNVPCSWIVSWLELGQHFWRHTKCKRCKQRDYVKCAVLIMPRRPRTKTMVVTIVITDQSVFLEEVGRMERHVKHPGSQCGALWIAWYILQHLHTYTNAHWYCGSECTYWYETQTACIPYNSEWWNIVGLCKKFCNKSNWVGHVGDNPLIHSWCVHTVLYRRIQHKMYLVCWRVLPVFSCHGHQSNRRIASVKMPIGVGKLKWVTSSDQSRKATVTGC